MQDRERNVWRYTLSTSLVHSYINTGRGHRVIRRALVVVSGRQRFGLHAMNAISACGLMKCMVVDWKIYADIVCTFIRKLIHGAKKRIYLIFEGYPM